MSVLSAQTPQSSPVLDCLIKGVIFVLHILKSGSRKLTLGIFIHLESSGTDTAAETQKKLYSKLKLKLSI